MWPASVGEPLDVARERWQTHSQARAGCSLVWNAQATAMSVKVLKITPSLTEIVKKLKEWNQKEASWVVS